MVAFHDVRDELRRRERTRVYVRVTIGLLGDRRFERGDDLCEVEPLRFARGSERDLAAAAIVEAVVAKHARAFRMIEDDLCEGRPGFDGELRHDACVQVQATCLTRNDGLAGIAGRA